METLGASDLVLLMLLGVTVVIITLRAMARADRLKQEALAKQAPPSVRRAADDGAAQREAAR